VSGNLSERVFLLDFAVTGILNCNHVTKQGRYIENIGLVVVKGVVTSGPQKGNFYKWLSYNLLRP
jgi:hypothetical protein